MPKDREVVYEPHPVTPERKAELRAAGYKIIDARFAPNPKVGRVDQGDDDAAKAGLADARAEYEAKLGKKPWHGWDADELRKRMAEASV